MQSQKCYYAATIEVKRVIYVSTENSDKTKII